MKPLWLFPVGVFVAGCIGDDEGDSTDQRGQDTARSACEGECGTISGFITGRQTTAPHPGAFVIAELWTTDLDDYDSGGWAWTDREGWYEIRVQPGVYQVYSSFDSEDNERCYSGSIFVRITEGEEQVVDIDIIDCYEPYCYR